MRVSLQILAAAAAAQAPDFAQLHLFATFTAKPAFEFETVIVEIGTFGPDVGGERKVYWFGRATTEEREDKLERRVRWEAFTNTDLCPAALAPLRRLERLAMPRPDVPGVGSDWHIVTTDGVGYTLAGTARHSKGHVGDYRIESNNGTPLAGWIQAMQRALEPCWKPLPAP